MSKIRIINENGVEEVADIFGNYEQVSKVNAVLKDGSKAILVRARSNDGIPTFRLKKQRKNK